VDEDEDEVQEEEVEVEDFSLLEMVVLAQLVEEGEEVEVVVQLMKEWNVGLERIAIVRIVNSSIQFQHLFLTN
jgi:hypothetical protein